ncbi:hypothetical protein AVEN_125056-1 [Araneus ventricosus]|uniref:Uncharacterized protein n=1 Tax=Araneus ventricosus TaxID=182803 RepID=A0A4Y2GQT0_ARAVE|nr:hypothetical protein AVEN_125056-1 [Araneus ventricosus]
MKFGMWISDYNCKSVSNFNYNRSKVRCKKAESVFFIILRSTKHAIFSSSLYEAQNTPYFLHHTTKHKTRHIVTVERGGESDTLVCIVALSPCPGPPGEKNQFYRIDQFRMNARRGGPALPQFRGAAKISALVAVPTLPKHRDVYAGGGVESDTFVREYARRSWGDLSR